MKKGILFLNGTPPEREFITKAAKLRTDGATDGIYCTDGAYLYLADCLTPDTVVGDFDSADINLIPDGCEKIVFNSDKDFTDGFLALKIMAERGFDYIDIYGAYGGRPDMQESNYLMLALARKLKIAAQLCGKCTTYLIGERVKIDIKVGATVSVVPFTDSVHILYMKGLRYGLSDYTMTKYADIESPNYIMGTSNVSVCNKVEIAATDGLALVFIQE